MNPVQYSPYNRSSPVRKEKKRKLTEATDHCWGSLFIYQINKEDKILFIVQKHKTVKHTSHSLFIIAPDKLPGEIKFMIIGAGWRWKRSVETSRPRRKKISLTYEIQLIRKSSSPLRMRNPKVNSNRLKNALEDQIIEKNHDHEDEPFI